MLNFLNNLVLVLVLSALISSSKSASIYGDDIRQLNVEYPIQFYQWPQDFYHGFQYTDSIQQPGNFQQPANFQQSGNFQQPDNFQQFDNFQQTSNFQQFDNFQQIDNFQQTLDENTGVIEIENISQPVVNENNQEAVNNESKNFLQNIFGIFQRPNRTTTVKTTTMSTMNIVQQRCVEDCIMRPPSQYNPVCGSDNKDYHNEERLNCARDCGVDVTLAYRGTCRRLESSTISSFTPAK